MAGFTHHNYRYKKESCKGGQSLYYGTKYILIWGNKMTLTYTEIIGLIFLLIATFNFGFIVYWFDDKLIKKEDEISDIEKNNQNKLNEFNVNIKAIAAWNNSLVETIKILKSILSISPLTFPPKIGPDFMLQFWT
jgi:hypothetical protein